MPRAKSARSRGICHQAPSPCHAASIELAGPRHAPTPPRRARPRRYLVRRSRAPRPAPRSTVSTMPRKRQPTRHERGHALLVGRVVDRRPAPPGPAGRLGQRAPPGTPRRPAGELPGVGRGPVHRRGGAGHPVRPAQRRARSAAACPAGWPGRSSSRRRTRPSSGSPTAGGPSPRCRRRHAEQLVRLDHLQALVDQGGRVDRDDRAHVPGRVRQRLLRRDRRSARRGAGPGTARRSRSAPAGAPRRAAPARRHWASAECSESTGTICPGRGQRGPHQRAAGDQRLLVRQREGPPGAQRGQRRREPERADHPVEHHVARPLGQLGHRLRARRGSSGIRNSPVA